MREDGRVADPIRLTESAGERPADDAKLAVQRWGGPDCGKPFWLPPEALVPGTLFTITANRVQQQYLLTFDRGLIKLKWRGTVTP